MTALKLPPPKPGSKWARFATSSLMEQRQAAKYSGYTWEAYNRLPGDPWYKGDEYTDSKAEVIAFYRLDVAMRGIEDSVRYG